MKKKYNATVHLFLVSLMTRYIRHFLNQEKEDNAKTLSAGFTRGFTLIWQIYRRFVGDIDLNERTQVRS